ncbi:TonB-dependent receptor plug domain-containing protein [Arcticibacter sp.]|uniref:TonB-dependent receptor plug domain-containing protein n=1 Tax=Arcticibacter sp. TaxID=1872630 RepID=UPI00388D1587
MRLFTTCLFALISLSLEAQVLTIKDKLTRQPVTTALIRVSNSEKAISADARGQVTIADIDRKSISIHSPGYRTLKLTGSQVAEQQFLVYLDESEFSLDDVVISASRWNQSKRDVPNKISTITKTEIVFQNPQTTADLLGQSGEVYIQKSQMSGGSPMIRGFATNRVLLTVDGVRMNNAIFRSGNLQNVISMDALATENVEVLFGPGSVMYGSDAIGGVMNFSTLSANNSGSGEVIFTGNALTRYSTANSEKTGHVDFNIGLKKWGFVTSVTYSDYGDLKMGSHGPAEYLRPEYAEVINGIDTRVTNGDPEKQVPTAFNQINLMEKIRFIPNENWTFNYGIHYSASSDNPRYDNLLRYRNGNLRSSEWYYGPQEWLMNNFSVTNTEQHRLYDNMRIGLSHQFFKESRHDRNFSNAFRTNNIEKVNAFALNIDFEKSIDEKNTITYGAEIIYNQVNSYGSRQNITDGTAENSVSRYPDDSSWGSYAAFITYKHKTSKKLHLQFGARYNHFKLDAEFNDDFLPFPFTNAQVNQGALTASAGLVYNPALSWQITTNLATGFRSPNIDDIGKVFESTPGSVVVPNPGLKSEYAYNIDAGVAKTFGDRVKIDATGYYTYLQDALVRRDFTLNGAGTIIYDGEESQVQAIQNAAYAYVFGVQAGVEIKLRAGFGLNSRFNYQKGKEELDNGDQAPLRHTAPWFGTSHLTYTWSKFKADIYAQYSGEVSFANLAPSEREKTYMYAIDADGNPYTPSFLTLNFKVLYQLTNNLMVNTGMENVTDRRYRPYSSGIVSAGRNLIISLRASF